jgi:hypothetical protein
MSEPAGRSIRKTEGRRKTRPEDYLNKEVAENTEFGLGYHSGFGAQHLFFIDLCELCDLLLDSLCSLWPSRAPHTNRPRTVE